MTKPTVEHFYETKLMSREDLKSRGMLIHHKYYYYAPSHQGALNSIKKRQKWLWKHMVGGLIAVDSVYNGNTAKEQTLLPLNIKNTFI